jgi:hypothetical protein
MAKVQTRIWAEKADLDYLSGEAAKRRQSRSQLIASIIGAHVDWLKQPIKVELSDIPTADKVAPPDQSNPDA